MSTTCNILLTTNRYNKIIFVLIISGLSVLLSFNAYATFTVDPPEGGTYTLTDDFADDNYGDGLAVYERDPPPCYGGWGNPEAFGTAILANLSGWANSDDTWAAKVYGNTLVGEKQGGFQLNFGPPEYNAITSSTFEWKMGVEALATGQSFKVLFTGCRRPSGRSQFGQGWLYSFI